MLPRTTSASASLTRRRSTASFTRQPIRSKSAIRPSQGGGFRSPSVTQEWLILNHAKDSVCITQFHQPPQIHDGCPVRYVPHDRRVVPDEHIGDTEPYCRSCSRFTTCD
jgi:hypothetical protein